MKRLLLIGMMCCTVGLFAQEEHAEAEAQPPIEYKWINFAILTAGLGYLIQQAEGVFDVAGVFAGMFVLAAFVLVIDMIVTVVEKRLLVWRPVTADARP